MFRKRVNPRQLHNEVATTLPNVKRSRPSLAHRLAQYLFFTGCIPLVIASLILITLSVSNSYQAAQKIEVAQATIISQRITNFVDISQKALNEVTFFDGLPNFDTTNQLAIMQGLADNNAAFLDIGLYDMQGNLKLSLQKKPVGTTDDTISHLGSCYQLVLGDKGCIGIPFPEPDTNRPVMELAGALHDNFGKVAGIIVVKLDLTRLTDVFTQVQGDPQTIFYIVDNRNQVIVSKNNSIQSFTLIGSNSALVQQLQTVSQHASDANYHLQSIYSNFSNDLVVGTFSPIIGTNWISVTELPIFDAYKSLTLQLIIALLLLGATFLAVRIVARLLARHLSQPLVLLNTAARQLGKGYYDQYLQLPDKTEAEFVELTMAFNQMSRELNNRFEQNRQLLTRTENQANRLQVLNQISRAVSSTLDLESLYIILDNELHKLIQFDSLVFLICEGEEIWKIAYLRGESILGQYTLGDLLSDQNRQNLQSYLNHQKNLQVISFGDLGASEFSLLEIFERSSVPTSSPLQSLLLLPVWREEQLLGLIVMSSFSKAEYNSEQLKLVEAVGVQLAIAIQNGRVYQQLSQAYDTLEQTQRALKRSARQSALGEMAAGIAHDFNNLVTTIMSSAQLLELKGIASTREDTQLLQAIINSSTDAAAIIRRINEFGRHYQPNNVVVLDLNEVVRGTIDMTRPYWQSATQKNNVQISLETDFSAVPVMVSGNLTEFREVLTNMIVNAVDAMPQGGKLAICTRLVDDTAELTLQDTGIGMSQEVRRHIFEAFYSTKGEKGSGLGLAVSYSIIRQFKGEIEVESELGKGSTFRILLPLHKSGQSSRQHGENTRFYGVSAQLNAHILVVEDEPNVRYVLQNLLKSEGYEVDEASNGQEAMKKLLANPYLYDLILTDLGMPIMGGLELAAQMTQNKMQLPIVLITGWRDALDENRAKLLNIRTIISKPFEITEILNIVDDILRENSYSPLS